MAEKTADVVCAKLGVDAPCRTRDTILLPHTAYYLN
jgi:glycerol-3-phosphate dehydrogenase